MDFTEKVKSKIRDVHDFPAPGIIFKDITPVLQDATLCGEILDQFILQFNSPLPEAIVSIESRGFMWGMLLANHFKVPFIPIRKQGKLPYKTLSKSYKLEYGEATMEMHTDALEKGMKVLIHDDLLATGGTAAAAANLVESAGAEILGFGFVIELGFLNGKEVLKKYAKPVEAIVSY